ncbi:MULTISPECIES: SDR family oxidoreductase [Nocardia]|uniref:SDR family oxidoreductase n=1 Tax=Nocardia TaxID=1817 RepID=UPI000BEF7153|nr:MULTISPECIES: SDR family oxidoreductase [Nocardia]MBF6185217.1 SDR family oxidoreductase [Nocardia farcinica]MBF6311053.1 SDR family oxidoreductase [Nocardia farcinica]MBF6407672.1 SDR family oxidoreductase [Nocardia farcinica]MBF6441124.1 SDR family oxidoreductase [Nocardia farcinica]MBF6524302.1 SDR family oxidoreductase [Nocardia farcinica]
MTRTRILITGASSGLGAGMAREFARKGRDLALCARRLELLEELRSELTTAHPDITVAVRALDVDDHAAVPRVFAELRAELGGLDRVIVNAGIGKGARLGTGRADANLATATTNFVSALAQAEAALEIFRGQDGGHLVLVSSMSAVRGLPGKKAAYSASKAGLAALGEALATEFAGSPIAVTTLLPGFIATDMAAKAGDAQLVAPLDKGVAAMVDAIERERRRACVPGWPWRLLDPVLPRLPDAVVRRLG